MIDHERFFKICKIVGVARIAERLEVVPTTIYTWRSMGKVTPLQWEKVQAFMDKFEKDNGPLLEKRLKEYEKKKKD